MERERERERSGRWGKYQGFKKEAQARLESRGRGVLNREPGILVAGYKEKAVPFNCQEYAMGPRCHFV